VPQAEPQEPEGGQVARGEQEGEQEEIWLEEKH
jgi:hypothetical protein